MKPGKLLIRSLLVLGLAQGVLAPNILPAAGSPSARAAQNWPQWLLSPKHGSYQKLGTVITKTNAASLVPQWTWVPDPPTLPGQPPAQLISSPVVFQGKIFIGAFTGDFYALDQATGAVLWKVFLGFQAAKTCPARGIVSTATVAVDRITHLARVYVAAPDGYLYALDPNSGGTLWRSLVADPDDPGPANKALNWSSPTVIGGRIYVGMSSNCDNPLIRGGLKEFDQSTGALLATYFTVPDGSVGGSIWSTSAAPNAKFVYVTTGNADPGPSDPGDSFSIVRLDGSTLVKQDIWTVPGLEGTDLDFGASPTLFTAMLNGTPTPMVGACNKNGNFYAWKQQDLAAGPVWQLHVGSFSCLAAAIWDGATLYVSSDKTIIGGLQKKGAIRALDPATGTPIWETALTGAVLGSPSMDGAGVIAVASYDYAPGSANKVWLIDAATGGTLATIDTSNNQVFCQPVFAGRFLLVATQDLGMTAYTPATEGSS